MAAWVLPVWVPQLQVCRSPAFITGALLWGAAIVGCLVVLARSGSPHSTGLKPGLLGSIGSLPDFDYDYDEAWSWDRYNIIAILLSVLVSLTSGPSGNGGGTFLVPLFNILLGFSIKEAAAITACVMAFGALTSVMCAVAEPHPNHFDRSIVDYRTVMIICPPMLFGISVGVIGNEVLPTWLVTYLMIGVFCLGTQKVTTSYMTLIKREMRQKKPPSQRKPSVAPPTRPQSPPNDGAAATASSSPPTSPFAEPAVQSSRRSVSFGPTKSLSAKHTDAAATAAAGNGQVAVDVPSSSDEDDVEAGERDKLLAGGTAASHTNGHGGAQQQHAADVANKVIVEEGEGPDAEHDPHGGRHAESSCWTRTPKQAAALLLAFIGIFIASELLRRGQEPCSLRYWGALAAEGVLSIALTLAIGLPLMLRHRRAEMALKDGEDGVRAPLIDPPPAAVRRLTRQPTLTSAEDAVQWTTHRLLYMPFGMFIAGVFAGLLGLGGGFITMPLLLTLGLHPQVTAASSKVILLISTFNTSLSYFLASRLNVTYAVVFGMINLLVSPIGIFLMNRLIKATGRPSHLVLLTLVRYALGTLILIGVNGVQRTLELFHGHVEGFDWQAACK